MHTTEPVSAREATEIMVENIYSIYAKVDLEQVAYNVVHMNTDERNKILGLLKEFDCFLGVSLIEWDTKTVKILLKPDYKPLYCKH